MVDKRQQSFQQINYRRLSHKIAEGFSSVISHVFQWETIIYKWNQLIFYCIREENKKDWPKIVFDSPKFFTHLKSPEMTPAALQELQWWMPSGRNVDSTSYWCLCSTYDLRMWPNLLYALLLIPRILKWPRITIVLFITKNLKCGMTEIAIISLCVHKEVGFDEENAQLSLENILWDFISWAIISQIW